MNTDVIRFGLVGYGAFAGKHARAVQKIEGCELSAVAVPSEASQARARSETGAAVYADYRELLSSADVDVIDVVAPNYLHEPVALAAFDAGKHVLLEKPMALDVAGCDRLIAAAKSANRLLLVGHEMHFSPLYLEIHRLIAEGRIGAPRYMLVDLWRRPYREGSRGWKQDPARVGSWTLEEPVHYFDLIGWYFENCGEPVSVSAFGNRQDPQAPAVAGIHEHFTAVVRYANGAYGVISQSISAVEHHLSVKIFGSTGVIASEWHAATDRSVLPSFTLSVSERGALKPVTVAGTPDDSYELEMELRALVHSIRTGAPLPYSPESARRAVALCIAAESCL